MWGNSRQLGISLLLYEAHNDSLPELLSKSIYTKRDNRYSLWGKDCLLVPRFHTRLITRVISGSFFTLYMTPEDLLCLNKGYHPSTASRSSQTFPTNQKTGNRGHPCSSGMLADKSGKSGVFLSS